MRGCLGSPLRASAVKNEARRSGGTRYEGMKKVVREIVQTEPCLNIFISYSASTVINKP